jgi:hypothetical protein
VRHTAPSSTHEHYLGRDQSAQQPPQRLGTYAAYQEYGQAEDDVPSSGFDPMGDGNADDFLNMWDPRQAAQQQAQQQQQQQYYQQMQMNQQQMQMNQQQMWAQSAQMGQYPYAQHQAYAQNQAWVAGGQYAGGQYAGGQYPTH